MEDRYMNIKVEREYSNRPRGLKHYSTESVIENALFDMDYIIHKMKMILKGDSNGKETTLAGSKDEEAEKEIRRGNLL